MQQSVWIDIEIQNLQFYSDDFVPFVHHLLVNYTYRHCDLMASELWSSKSKVSDWTECHRAYFETIADHKVSDLEVWYQNDLPSIIEKQKCIRKDQFVRLIDWKNKRGKFRPALVKYAREQDDAALQKASKEAREIFEAHRDEKYLPVNVVMDAMSCLTSLKGMCDKHE
jgi:hypothetical protein